MIPLIQIDTDQYEHKMRCELIHSTFAPDVNTDQYYRMQVTIEMTM